MIDREKVIERLKHCPVHCNPECPYYWNDISDFTECQIRLHMYAIDLLEAQEPRVMTPTEAYTADFVYVEFAGVITPALRTSNEREGHRESYFATQQLGGEWMRWDDYGITWRCWTSRPTDEQGEAIAWEC